MNSCVVDPTYQNIETWAKKVVCVVMSISMKRTGGGGFLSALAAKAAARLFQRVRFRQAQSFCRHLRTGTTSTYLLNSRLSLN